MKTLLRWIAVPLSAVFGSWLVYAIVKVTTRVSWLLITGWSWWPPEIEKWLEQAYIETMSGLALGAAAIYLGSKVAPSAKQAAAFWLGALFVTAALVTVGAGIVVQNWWAVYEALVIGFGAAATAFDLSYQPEPAWPWDDEAQGP